MTNLYKLVVVPLLGMGILVAGCAQQPKLLYSWESYPRIQYDTLLRAGSSPAAQIRDMQAHAEKARASNSALPPGFRAHLGMLQLSTGNAGEARMLWLAEKSTFPESTPYMDQLLKRLDAPTNGASTK
ncbi:MAG: DUF4810 domain-containing protein [Betaproteobacteria bacterium]|jgi:hypothetical protein